MRWPKRDSRPPDLLTSFLVTQFMLSRATNPMELSKVHAGHDQTARQNAKQYELSMLGAVNTYKPAFAPKLKKTIKSELVFPMMKNLNRNVTRHCGRPEVEVYKRPIFIL